MISLMFIHVGIWFDNNGYLTNPYLYKSYCGIYVSDTFLHNNTSLDSNILPFHIPYSSPVIKHLQAI